MEQENDDTQDEEEFESTPIEIPVNRIESEQLEEEVLPEIIDYREDIADNPEGHDSFVDEIVPSLTESMPGPVEMDLENWETLVVLMNVPRVKEAVGITRLEYIEGKLTRRLMKTQYEASKE